MELKTTNLTLGSNSRDGNFERFLLLYFFVFLAMHFTMKVYDFYNTNNDKNN